MTAAYDTVCLSDSLSHTHTRPVGLMDSVFIVSCNGIVMTLGDGSQSSSEVSNRLGNKYTPLLSSTLPHIVYACHLWPGPYCVSPLYNFIQVVIGDYIDVDNASSSSAGCLELQWKLFS